MAKNRYITHVAKRADCFRMAGRSLAPLKTTIHANNAQAGYNVVLIARLAAGSGRFGRWRRWYRINGGRGLADRKAPDTAQDQGRDEFGLEFIIVAVGVTAQNAPDVARLDGRGDCPAHVRAQDLPRLVASQDVADLVAHNVLLVQARRVLFIEHVVSRSRVPNQVPHTLPTTMSCDMRTIGSSDRRKFRRLITA